MGKIFEADRVARAVSWLVGGVTVVFLWSKLFEPNSVVPKLWWPQLLGVVVSLLLGFVAVALSRYALGFRLSTDPQSGAAAVVDVDAPIRSRLAPLIIGIGTAGIVVLAVTIILLLTFAGTAEIKDRLDTLLLSVFSAVLPVFATWVGTILAFYYSNESFRQASDAARGGAGGEKAEEVSKSKLMFGYDKIARYELKPSEDANAVPMTKIRDLLKPPASRIMIFTSDRKPVYVIRKKLDFPEDEQTPLQTVKEYLARDSNTADARNFYFIPLRITIDEARTLLNVYRATDLFANDSGSPDEPVKGWLSDDALK